MNKTRFDDCIFCAYNHKCGILEKTTCTENKKSECTFYKTEVEFIEGRNKANRLLTAKGKKVAVIDNIVTTVPLDEF